MNEQDFIDKLRGYRVVIIVGGPRTGKSTLARKMRELGFQTYCTDPRSMVKEPEEGVTYLPEGLALRNSSGGGSEDSRYVADNWLAALQTGAVVEGWGTARAIRKLLREGRREVLNGCRIVKFTRQYEEAVTKPGQRAMAKAVETVWSEIAMDVRHITVVAS